MNLRNPDSVNWSEPFRFGDNLRVVTPIDPGHLTRKTREHLVAMNPEHRAELERAWLEAEAAVPSVHNRISDEIKARADAEWEALDRLNALAEQEGR